MQNETLIKQIESLLNEQKSMKHPKVRWVMQAADALAASYNALSGPVKITDLTELDPKLILAIQNDLKRDMEPQLEDARKDLNQAELRVLDLERIIEAQGEVIKQLADLVDEWRRVL